MYTAIVIVSLICLVLTFSISLAIYAPLWISMFRAKSPRVVKLQSIFAGFGSSLLGLVYAQVHYVVSGDRLTLFLASTGHFILPVVGILIALRYVGKAADKDGDQSTFHPANKDQMEQVKEAANG